MAIVQSLLNRKPNDLKHAYPRIICHLRRSHRIKWLHGKMNSVSKSSLLVSVHTTEITILKLLSLVMVRVQSLILMPMRIISKKHVLSKQTQPFAPLYSITLLAKIFMKVYQLESGTSISTIQNWLSQATGARKLVIKNIKLNSKRTNELLASNQVEETKQAMHYTTTSNLSSAGWLSEQPHIYFLQ